MKKSELRKFYLAKRLGLSRDEVQRFSELIFNNFRRNFLVEENQKVHCFLPIAEKNEVNTQFFFRYFFEKKCRVFVPKIKGGELIAVEYTAEAKLIRNSWGILEPESSEDSKTRDFDFVITPLLYCDNAGNRVGYGKGFYDGFFSELSAGTAKVGVNFFPPAEEIDDVSATDIGLNYLVTPTEVLSFGTLASKSTK